MQLFNNDSSLIAGSFSEVYQIFHDTVPNQIIRDTWKTPIEDISLTYKFISPRQQDEVAGYSEVALDF